MCFVQGKNSFRAPMAPAPAYAFAQMYIVNNILQKKAIDFVYRDTKIRYDDTVQTASNSTCFCVHILYEEGTM